MSEKIGKQQIKDFYNQNQVVDHYQRATSNVGLWVSEEIIFTRQFEKTDRILELGCGTGRISIGLSELGYENLLGIELSKAMVKEARRIANILGESVAFRQGDATKLSLDDDLFDGAIFGFNGLMQIPGRENRRQALREIRRVVKQGGIFCFTTHDRTINKYKKYWRQEQKRWDRGEQQAELLEYGDRWEETELGEVFIHVPMPEDVREDLSATGWRAKWDSLRSKIANEPPPVRDFSDECRFWVAEAI